MKDTFNLDTRIGSDINIIEGSYGHFENTVTSEDGRYTVPQTLYYNSNLSTVYRAIDNRTGKEVAIKIGKKDIDPYEEGGSKIFLSEARHIKALQEKHLEEEGTKLLIPEIIDFTIAEINGEKRPILVTEWIEGQPMIINNIEYKFSSIHEFIQRHYDVAQTLDYCHENNVIHGDLKPSQYIIGDDGHTYVLDFGLSNIGSTNKKIRGTTSYTPMSVRISKEWTVEKEKKFFVEMMYRMLTGKSPYNIEHLATVGNKDISIIFDNGEKYVSIYPQHDGVEKTLQLSRVKSHALDKLFENALIGDGLKNISCSQFIQRMIDTIEETI